MAGALLHNEEMCAEYLANGEKNQEKQSWTWFLNLLDVQNVSIDKKMFKINYICIKIVDTIYSLCKNGVCIVTISLILIASTLAVQKDAFHLVFLNRNSLS